MPLIIQPMDFELLYKSRKIEKKFDILYLFISIFSILHHQLFL